VPINVDDGEELGMRARSDLPEALKNIKPELIDARHRKLK